MRITFWTKDAYTKLYGDSPEEFWANAKRYGSGVVDMHFADAAELRQYLYIAPSRFYAFTYDENGGGTFIRRDSDWWNDHDKYAFLNTIPATVSTKSILMD